MASRLELQSKLEDILGSENVYFQPSESLKLKYPCIVYDLENTDVQRADNKAYMTMNRYHIKHIFKALSNEKKDDLLNNFMMIEHNNRMKAEGLYNDDFTLYF